MKILISVIVVFISLGVTAQVVIEEEASVSNFMNEYVSKNQESSSVKAWKIQIITTNDRRKMEQAITKFEQYFPEYESQWFHENPYYKVKVGAFETKEDLYSFLLSVKQHFSGAIPVVDSIEKSELVKP